MRIWRLVLRCELHLRLIAAWVRAVFRSVKLPDSR